MSKILHLIDRNTPADMLAQLALLAGPDDDIISVGPPPDLPAGHPVRAIHEPVGSAVLCGLRLRPRARDVAVIHVWSARAHRAGQVATIAGNARLVRSVPAVPRGGKPLARLLRSLGPQPIAVTVPTEAARARFVRAGMDGRRLRLLPPAAATIADAADRRRRTRAELDIADDALVLVAPDAMIRPADLNSAVWAHAIMQYVLDDPSWLLLPTRGPMERAVMAFARGAGAIDRIIGPRRADRLGDALAAADIAMFLRADDCGSAAVAAAMAAGLPIVAFDTPDVVECVGPAALPTEARTPRAAAQALLKLIEHPEIAHRLRQQAVRRAAAFAVDGVRCKLEAVYDSLASSRLEPTSPAGV